MKKIVVMVLTVVVYLLAQNQQVLASSESYRISVQEEQNVTTEYTYKTKVVKVSLLLYSDQTQRFYVKSAATGFMLPNGYILTNYHVAPEYYEGSKKLRYEVQFYNQTIELESADADIVVSDKDNDLSILKINTDVIPEPYINSYFSEFSTDYKVGDKVMTVGQPVEYFIGSDTKPKHQCPKGEIDECKPVRYSWKVSTGTIQNINTDELVNYGKDDLTLMKNVVSMSLDSYGGNSGGPIIDTGGKIVGILFASNMCGKSSAIKSDTILNLIKSQNLYDKIFK